MGVASTRNGVVNRKVNEPLSPLVTLPLRWSGVAAFGSLRDSGPETAPKGRRPAARATGRPTGGSEASAEDTPRVESSLRRRGSPTVEPTTSVEGEAADGTTTSVEVKSERSKQHSGAAETTGHRLKASAGSRNERRGFGTRVRPKGEAVRGGTRRARTLPGSERRLRATIARDQGTRARIPYRTVEVNPSGRAETV